MLDPHKLEFAIRNFENLLETARRNRKRLTGRGFYAKKARNLGGALRRDISAAASVLRERARPDLAQDIEGYSDLLVRSDLALEEKLELIDELVLRWESEFKPIIEREVALEDYLPEEFFANLPQPFQVVASEVNTCFRGRLWNGALVLVRRLAETLIIEWYEDSRRAAEITDGQGRYLRFGELVGKVKSGQALRLSQPAIRTLDKIKVLADSAAHNRYFLARQGDLAGMGVEVRVFFEEIAGKVRALLSR